MFQADGIKVRRRGGVREGGSPQNGGEIEGLEPQLYGSREECGQGSGVQALGGCSIVTRKRGPRIRFYLLICDVSKEFIIIFQILFHFGFTFPL